MSGFSGSYNLHYFQFVPTKSDKFRDDHYHYEDESSMLATDGVLFEADDAPSAMERYRNGEECFWNTWRGSFCGVHYDKKADILRLFNDHIGSKMLFYTQSKGVFYFSSDLYSLALKTNAKADNENYLWQLLLYGYSPVGETVFTNIHRLQAGEYILVKGTQYEKKIYHRFDNTPNQLSIEENINRIDAAFRRAVERVIRKNEQYGYTHYLPLSAGLDSRMTNRVAEEFATTPIHHITYSQSGFYDDIIPHELANYWQEPLHFTPLDGGKCLEALDAVSKLTYGLVQYSGAAETLYGLPEEAKREGGVFLTGMVGDIIIGTAYTERDKNQQYHVGEGAIMQRGIATVAHSLPENYEKFFPNRELFYLYVRGFNCANLGSPLVQQQYGESYSPFCDVDVLTAAYACPLEQRWNYRLYDQWILHYYPDMAQWKHNGIYTIGHRPKIVSIMGRTIPLNDLPKRAIWYLLKKLHIHDFYHQTEGCSMTPEDSWFEKNADLRNWAENYITANIHLLNDYPKIKEKAVRLIATDATGSMQVLSVLACLRQTR